MEYPLVPVGNLEILCLGCPPGGTILKKLKKSILLIVPNGKIYIQI